LVELQTDFDQNGLYKIMISLDVLELHILHIMNQNMMELVPLHQTSPKMNKDESMLVVIHKTWKLATQKENMLLLFEIYLLANSTLETCVLEALLMTGLALIG